MSAKEQIRRITKAASHLPIQALTSLVLVFAIPFLIVQIFTSFSTRWSQTNAIIKKNSGVQSRLKNDKPEFFYSIDYSFIANNKEFIIPFEKGFGNKSVAEDDLQSKLIEQKLETIWYDYSNPLNCSFEEVSSQWQVYFGILLLLIFVLIYFRWLMLKYYELELT